MPKNQNFKEIKEFQRELKKKNLLLVVYGNLAN